MKIIHDDFELFLALDRIALNKYVSILWFKIFSSIDNTNYRYLKLNLDKKE